MTCRRVVFAWCALVLAASVSPANAQDYWYGYWRHSRHWRIVDGAIYELNNRIAFLEADPEIDDGYKGRIISRARRDIRRLQRHALSGTMGMAVAVLLWPQAHSHPMNCTSDEAQPLKPQPAEGAPSCPGGRRPNIRCRVRCDQPLSRSR